MKIAVLPAEIGLAALAGAVPGSGVPPADPCAHIEPIEIQSVQSDSNVTSPGERLLRDMWRSPDLCHQFGTMSRSTGCYRNIPAQSGEDVCARASSLATTGLDVYFACAEFKSSVGRTKENAAGAYAFWMDVDCGETKAGGHKGFLTLDAARSAITRFCKQAGLPEPTHIVASGGGLHVYWVLDKFVSRIMWESYAEKLKALSKALGLLADGNRTADIASVLRIPGTLNWKTKPPRPVSLEGSTSDWIDRTSMLGAIDLAYHQYVRPVQAVRTPRLAPTADPLRLIGAALEYLDPDCDYDDWLRIGAAIFHETGASSEGFELYRKWSEKGAKYRGVRDVRAKWQSFRPDHPRPATIGTLSWMLRTRGYDWVAIVDAAEDQFEVTRAAGESI